MCLKIYYSCYLKKLFLFYRWKLQIKQLLLNSLNQIEAKKLFIPLSKIFEKIIPICFNMYDWFGIWSSCFLKSCSSSKPVFRFFSRFHCGCTHRITVVICTWSHFMKENYQQLYKCVKISIQNIYIRLETLFSAAWSCKADAFPILKNVGMFLSYIGMRYIYSP